MKKPLNNTEVSQNSEKLKNELALVEAALYVAGRPLNLSDLCSVLRTRSKNKVRNLVKTLMREYASRNTALEILELKDERYVLQLKAEFTPHVRKLVKRPLLSTGPLKTLSYIALKQPVSQKRVTEVRGHHAYGHIKLLKEMGLIVSERKGRSSVLRTTDYFADYFGLSHDVTAMKRELRKILEGEKAEEANKSPPTSTEKG
ncbi:MAG: SMC-Scp complex subunit ScpB [Nitrososphaerota archaeon]|nr:SMC-Scp complex subunit ScpB [Candidatus Bathyarchaeota archaeon]MDW8023591.1 SMC-Scp complex subunit ScpB [Nitrososphaerota archaeon]